MSCHAPVYHKMKGSKSYECFPCGKCKACRSLRTQGWVFRLLQEEKISQSAYFITLTYANENLHYGVDGKPVLCKRDLQLFFKRLRKAHGVHRRLLSNHEKFTSEIKYYAVGEYGGRFKRPHYHVILFNADPQLVEKTWMKGKIHYGDVCGYSVGYTMKYIGEPRKNEFSLMSKGIGENYLTKNMIRWHNTVPADRCYVVNDKGHKMAMPRYYRDRIYSKDEKKIIGYFTKQKRRALDGAMTAFDEFNLNETRKYHLKKLGNVEKIQVEDSLQCYGVSEGLRKASRRIINSTGSDNASEDVTRKIRKRSSVAVC